MTKAEAWDIVSGIAENMDANDMTQLIEHLDDLLRKQIDTEKKLNKAAKERQVIVTWYRPEEKLPPDDRDVVVTFSGSTKKCMYIHAFGIARCCSECEYEKPAWGIFGFSVGKSMKMHVEAWADLDPYGMG